MRLIKFNTINSEGNITEISVNPEQVCFVVPILIPNPHVVGLDGKPVPKEASGLDFGVKIVPVEGTIEEVEKRLLGEEK